MVAAERAPHARQISELQSAAPEVFAEAANGAVEIRRYSEPIGYVESVEEHREHQEMDAALNRTIWALDLQKALRNVSEGRYKQWGEVAAKLRARYPGR